MKKIHIYGLLFIAVITLFTVPAFAQVGPPPEEMRDGPPPPDGPRGRGGDRGKMLRDLGLSREQLQQIRKMNQERKPVMDAAHRRMAEANKALDQAIYADTLNEAEIESRLKEVHAAQNELNRLRYMNELQVRKVLTPEQLVKFREMREKFERIRENIRDRVEDRRQSPPRDGQPGRPAGNRLGGPPPRQF